MAFTTAQFNMFVVKPGGMYIDNLTFKGDASTTFVKGDLVRITTTGTIKDASATDTGGQGSCHGMILDTWATAPAATENVPIMVWADDTVLAAQVYGVSGVAADSEPQDCAIGVAYTLRNDAAGIWSVTTTTTNGHAMVVAKPSDSKWFEPLVYGAGVDYGIVHVRFLQANLDGRSS